MLGLIHVELIFVEGPLGSSAVFTDDERRDIRIALLSGVSLLTRLGERWGASRPTRVAEVCTFDVDWRVVSLPIDPATIPSSSVSNPVDTSLIPQRDDVWQAALATQLGHPGAKSIEPYMRDQRRFLRGQRRFGKVYGDAIAVLVTKYGCHWPGYAMPAQGVAVIWYPENDDALYAVLAHEIGHLFGAPDEYGHCSATDPAGFFDTPNSNCVLLAGAPNPAGTVACLMSHTTPVACTHTEMHWGWSDAIADGVADLLAPSIFTVKKDPPFGGIVRPGDKIRLQGLNTWDARTVTFRPLLGGAVTTAQPSVLSRDTVEVEVPALVDQVVEVEYTTRAGVPATSSNGTLLIASAPPVVSDQPVVWGVIPNTAAPGSTVRILGANLSNPTAVLFGGATADLATIVVPDDPFATQDDFTVQVPVGAGSVDVTVRTSQGDSLPFPPFSGFTFL
jgi:hypothetical protein